MNVTWLQGAEHAHLTSSIVVKSGETSQPKIVRHFRPKLGQQNILAVLVLLL